MYPLRLSRSGIRVLTSMFACACASSLIVVETQAADHGDTPFLMNEGRPDARITDLFAFVRGSNLVLAVGMNPGICGSDDPYQHPSDLTIDIDIDNQALVTPDASNPFGGIIASDYKVKQAIRYRVTFDDDGNPTVDAIPGTAPQPTAVFVDIRDDPFIRTPRQEPAVNPAAPCNVAAIVLEVPLSQVLSDQDTILVWASAALDEFDQVEEAGRALRNQFFTGGEQDARSECLNVNKPKQHGKLCGLQPDVIIYDTSSNPAQFPNGRELIDDVDQLAEHLPGAPNWSPNPLKGNPAEFTTVNNVPFLNAFPYLAPPNPK